MMTIDPKSQTPSRLHAYLLSAVVPRPIAFASTIDPAGNVNLSPFSFFNCFGSNPPILVFSPSRRGRDNTTKHTYDNVKAVAEVVINIVSYEMVEQASLSSCEFPAGVNEFKKAGFTEVRSERIKPPRVGESPVSFECKVNQVIELGTEGSAGNLVICEILLMHINEKVLDENGRIDPLKLDAVARMGGDNYLRMSERNIFTVPKPSDKLGIGFDQIPDELLRSKVLTGNDLGRLASIEQLPSPSESQEIMQDEEVRTVLKEGPDASHRLAQQFIKLGKTFDAWRILLAARQR
ncbi:MAG TPA: flavin reductase family protein [Cyclobacteriaceae bacterium]|nr:flavin reductase family protein [Cyclobacteriaceae bacterium]